MEELMKNPNECHVLNAEENAWFNYQRSLPVKTPIPHVRGEISCSLKETFSVSVTTHKSQLIIPKNIFSSNI